MFFLKPLLITALAYLFIIFVRYRREHDIIRMLPYLFQKDTWLTLVAVFLTTSFLQVLLKLFE